MIRRNRPRPRRRTGKTADAIIRLQKGSRQRSAADKFDYSFYDSMKIAAANSEIRMFQHAVGQNGKNLCDTNMKTGGSIPQGSNFRVHVMKVFYTTATPKTAVTKLFEMFKNTTLEIILDGKADLGTYTLSEIFGNPLMFDLDSAAEGTFSAGSFSTFKGVLPFNFPIDLAALQQFEIKIRHFVAPDSTLADDKLQVSLNGRMYRLS